MIPSVIIRKSNDGKWETFCVCWGAHLAFRNNLTWTTLLLWSYLSVAGDNTITLIDFQVRVTVWSSRLGRRPMRSRSPIHYRLLRHRRRRCLQDGWVRISRRATSYGFFSSRLRQSKSLCSAVVTVFQRKGELNYRKRQQNSVDLISVQRNCHKVHFAIEWPLLQPSINMEPSTSYSFHRNEGKLHLQPIILWEFWSPHLFVFVSVEHPWVFFFLSRKTSHRFLRVIFLIL